MLSKTQNLAPFLQIFFLLGLTKSFPFIELALAFLDDAGIEGIEL